MSIFRKRVLSLGLAVALTASLVSSAAAGRVNNYNSVAAAGISHSLAVKDDGTVWAWGTNKSYQLGVEGLTESLEPVQVPGISAVIAVAAGYDFSVALKYDGKVFAWGFKTDAVPQAVQGLENVVSIAAGQTSILALKADGSVWQWTYGQTPSQVWGISRVAKIAAGGAHFLALTCTGEVWSWGDNSYGQIGNGTKAPQYYPDQISTLFNIVDIAAGQSHSLAVSFDGTVYAWGANLYGQLGDATTTDNSSPIAVKGLKEMEAVAAGGAYSIALNEKGTVYAWGYGEYGQMGNGAMPISQAKPATVNATNGATKQIAAGVAHGLLVTGGNALYAWGRNNNYQIGNEKNGNAATPQQILNGVRKAEPYVITRLTDMSSWARKEVEPLVGGQLVPPLWWGNYTQNATRAEFAHLLVSTYETVKNTAINPSKTIQFGDIEGHPLAEDIKKAAQLGIMSGIAGGTLAAPDANITRQEAVKMLCSFVAKINGTTVPTKLQSLAFYKDAADIDKWAAPYIYYAYQNDIMKGGNDGNFSPKAQISRQECLVVLARLAEQNKWIK